VFVGVRMLPESAGEAPFPNVGERRQTLLKSRGLRYRLLYGAAPKNQPAEGYDTRKQHGCGQCHVKDANDTVLTSFGPPTRRRRGRGSRDFKSTR